MSGGTRSRGRVFVTGLLLWCTAAALGSAATTVATTAAAGVVAGSPAQVDAPPQVSTPDTPMAEMSESTSVIGAAAATGAGSAAGEVLGDVAERAARAAAAT